MLTQVEFESVGECHVVWVIGKEHLIGRARRNRAVQLWTCLCLCQRWHFQGLCNIIICLLLQRAPTGLLQRQCIGANTGVALLRLFCQGFEHDGLDGWRQLTIQHSDFDTARLQGVEQALLLRRELDKSNKDDTHASHVEVCGVAREHIGKLRRVERFGAA